MMSGEVAKGATLESSPADNLTGTIAGRFAIHARLGAGGMGEVYRAEDLRLRRSVAIKRLSPQLAADPDPHYEQYPRLPVLRCVGYEAAMTSDEGSDAGQVASRQPHGSC